MSRSVLLSFVKNLRDWGRGYRYCCVRPYIESSYLGKTCWDIGMHAIHGGTNLVGISWYEL